MIPLNTEVVANAQAQIDALIATLPRIETEHLILRAPKLTDWPVLEPIWTTERGKFIGGPMDAEEAWLDFNHLTASWILRGFGALVITLKGDDDPLGLVLIEHEMGDPEPELGWLLTETAEGKGYAYEAAQALLPLAHSLFGAGGFVSYIHRDNHRSIALAQKLGAVADSQGHPAFPEGLVFRHGGQA